MADGDYERGRGREIAGYSALLKRLAEVRRPRVIVLNGWAASTAAWSLCSFRRDRLFSYVDQLDGLPESYIDSLNPSTPLVLVGWSMGGSYALRLACEYSARLAGLVLVAATPRMMEERDVGWKGMSPRRLDALRKGLELTHGEGFFGVAEGRPNPYQLDSSENLERGLAYLLDTDLRARLERMPTLGCPVSIFQSDHDGIVRPENADYLARIFPQAQVRRVAGSEHALPIIISQEIDHAVDACLAVPASGAHSR